MQKPATPELIRISKLKAPKLRILFVCRGNSCRSPIAAGIANKLLAPRVNARSAGVVVVERSANSVAIRVMRRVYGVDLLAHVPTGLQELRLKEYDYFVAMDPVVAQDLQRRFQVPCRKLVVWDAKDPYLKGEAEYRRCSKRIHDLVKHLGRQLGLAKGDHR